MKLETKTSMKKFIIIASLIGSCLLILDSFNAGSALVMFFLVGIIPGTDLSLSADRMLEIFALLTGFTLSRITKYVVKNSAKNGLRAYPSKGTMLSAQS